MCEADEAKRHTSIAEMARECAEHQGSMIVDVEIKPGGETHIHAVATWEPQELSAAPPAAPPAPGKPRPPGPISNLTDEALLAEWREWDIKVRTAPRWGSALAAAVEFCTIREREIRRRGLKHPGAPVC